MFARGLPRWFWIQCVLIVPMILVLAILDAELKNPLVAGGIVDFEFCGWQGQCAAMLASWNAAQRETLMLLQGLDYLFLLQYPALLVTAWLWAMPMARRSPLRFKVLVGLALITAFSDAVENFALIQLVRGAQWALWGQVASSAAALKFTVLAVLIVGVLVQLTGRAMARLSASREGAGH